MKKCIAALTAALLVLSAAGCTGTQSQQDSVTKTNLMLDTVITITLHDWQDASTIDLAFDEISRLEDLLSVEQ